MQISRPPFNLTYFDYGEVWRYVYSILYILKCICVTDVEELVRNFVS